MTGSSVRIRWAGLLTAGVVAAGILATGSAAADQARGPAAATTITMKVANQRLKFVGPESVAAGTALEIVNKTNPQGHGPHTFTLIREDLLPKGKQKRRCENLKYKPCEQAFIAHDVDPQTFAVGEPIVENGEEGWDAFFTSAADGDSWYTETRNEAHSRPVSAASGETLAFFCLVHPFMKGKIEVTD